MELTANNVNEIMRDCTTNADTEVIEGVVLSSRFNKEALERRKKDICDMLSQLPSDFKKTVGGGWSFLNMCQRSDGCQWTGLHQTVDCLVLLGIAVGAAEFLWPREAWGLMPGGMPYIVVNDEQSLC